MIRRNTKAKAKILELFNESHIVTAVQIINTFPDMDKVTIYRNITRLVEDGILKELHIKNGIASYELAKHSDHQHFVCEKCESILPVEISQEQLKKLLPANVTVDEIELNMRGICKDCSENEHNV